MSEPMTVDDVLKIIDTATWPAMTKANAVEFMEQIIADLESRIEAIREEVANDKLETQ